MKTARIKAIPKKDVLAICQRIENYLGFIGGKRDDDLGWWTIETKYGACRIKPDHIETDTRWEPVHLFFVFVRFDDPARARPTGCNPHSGKCNQMIDGDWFAEVGLDAAVDSILDAINRLRAKG